MNNLTCPRCKQPYSVKFYEYEGSQRCPLLLRCGHTFCAVCIQKLSRKHDLVSCPTCQTPIKVGADGSKSVHANKYAIGCMWMKRMELEIQSRKISERPKMKAKSRQQESCARNRVTCWKCLTNNAICQCLQCESIMCSVCFNQIHESSNTLQKHTALALTASTLESRPDTLRLIMPLKKKHEQYCPVHDKCHLEYYCKDDQQSICSRCVIIGDHKGHKVETLEDKNKELVQDMESAVLDAQETLWRLEKSEKVLEENMPTARVDIELMEKVRDIFMSLHSQLQAREEQLVDEIRDMSLKATSSFHEMKRYIESEKLLLEGALMDSARVKIGSLNLVNTDQIMDCLKRAKDLPCVITVNKEAVTTPIKFTHEASLKEIIQQYGSVSVADSTQMISLTSAGPGAEKPPVEELRFYSVAEINTESLSSPESMSVCGSVVVEEKTSDSLDEEVLSAELNDARAMTLLPMKRLIAGNYELVTVTHILTPAHFYIQQVRRTMEMEELQQRIFKHCAHTKGRSNWPDSLEIGTLVLARYDRDKKWYRARVIDMMKTDSTVPYSKATVKVFFIDYGNTAVLTRRKMKKMEKQFTVHSVFAHRCCLFDILPANEKRGWTRESVETMQEMTRNGPLFMVVVKKKGEELEVDLGSTDPQVQGRDEHPVSVRDSLVFLRLAMFNTNGHKLKTVMSMWKTDYLTLPGVDEGAILNIGINCMYSPSLFFAQLCTEESHDYLQRLLIAIQEVYSQETKHLYRIYFPKTGMMCVARYAKDNKWYRARVIAVPFPRQVEVQFVDYGNKELVDIADICRILDDHIQYPMQALEMTLADVEPVDGVLWSEEANAWLRSVAELQLGQFRVTERSEKPNSLRGVMYVINYQTNRLCSVNYQLVKLGLARSTGPWSCTESFEGITLNSEMLDSVTMSPASPEPPSPLSGTYHIGFPPLHTSMPQPEGMVAWRRGTWAASQAIRTRGKPGWSSSVIVTAQDQNDGDSANTSTECTATSSTSTTAAAIVNAAAQVVREVELEVGESMELQKGAARGCVCMYNSPNHFYIQLQDKAQELSRLMEDMELYERAHVSSRCWKAGEFCAARSSQDQCWYRGQILEETEEKGNFLVKLVDYGWEVKIPSRHLKPLRQIHSKQDFFAERCHIADLMPTGIDCTRWSSTATEYVSKLIGKNTIYIRLKGDRVPQLGLPVDLLIEVTIPPTALDPAMVKYVSVASKLEDRGLAIPIKKEKVDKPAEQDSTETTDMFITKPVATLQHSYDDNDCDDDEEVGEEACTKVIVQPDLEVAPHPPPTSTKIHVMPVHVDPQGVIYAQDFTEGSQILELLETLQEYSEHSAPEGLLQVSVGQVCVAFCRDYNYWLRARVLAVNPNHVQVQFIDYGNSSRVHKTQLKMITPKLCINHQLVYELRLVDAPPTIQGAENETLLKEYVERLSMDFINKSSLALVKGSLREHPLVVNLVDYKKEDASDYKQDDADDSVKNCADDDSNYLNSMADPMEEFYERSTDIADILKTLNPYPQLKVGQKGDMFHAVVTHLELPNMVFLQRCENPFDSSISRDLQEFDQMMGDLSSLPTQTPTLQELPPVGSMCSAQYGQDQCWYRGLVVKVFPKDKEVLVLYVDYGNSELVPLGDRLRILPPRFQDTVAQSVCASLNLTLPEGVTRWSLDTYLAMAKTIYEKQFYVLIKETEPLVVELYNRTDDKTLAYEGLIQKGLVVVPRPDISPCTRAVSEESSIEEEGSTTSDLD